MARTPKSANAPERGDDKTVKLNLSLPAELAKRFGVHAEMLGISKSDLFADLVKSGCKRFVVHDHKTKAGDSAEATDAA